MASDDPLSSFERAQRQWLAKDPPVVVDGDRSQLPTFLADLLDPVIPLPAGVAHDPWLPQVSGRSRSLLGVAVGAWFVVMVVLFTALLAGNVALGGVLVVPAIVLGVVAYRTWLPPAREREAERRLDDGTWREGRHLTSSACLLVRGDRVDLVPRHRLVEVRERSAVGDDGRTGSRLELVVDDAGRRRTIPLPSQAADDLAAVREWLDDAAWVTAFPGAWTWGVHVVESLDALALALAHRPWPLDAGFRMGDDWLVQDVPSDDAERWVVLGTASDGAVRATVEVLVPRARRADPEAVRALLRDGLAARRDIDVDALDGTDLRPRLESPERHGVTALSLTMAAREVRARPDG